MRKVLVQEFVSLDGLASGPKDSVNFVPASMQGDKRFALEQLALMDRVDALLLGRKTYSMFAGYWPNVPEGDEKEFADKINATLKIVFSKTLERAPWGNWTEGRIVRGSAAEEVRKLRQESGKDLLIWGSLSLVQDLAAAGLVDEYRLVLCPVVLGDGRSLFRDAAHLQLAGSKALDRGAVSLTYTPRDHQ